MRLAALGALRAWAARRNNGGAAPRSLLKGIIPLRIPTQERLLLELIIRGGIALKLWKFALTRIALWFLTILVGVTIVFFIQRILPSDPIEAMIGKIVTMGSTMTPESIQAIRESLMKQYGLSGTLLEQYGATIVRMMTLDFGPSMSSYPMEVSAMIGQALPYTVGLLLSTTLLSWIIGNAIGLLAGFKKNKWYAKALETVSMCIYPMPYFIIALIIMIMCAYINRWFPLIPSMPAFEPTLAWIKGIVYNSFMPALSLMLVGTGWWIISMKSLSSNVAEEDYVNYGRLKGLRESTIGYRYVFRNSILSQVTALALNIGGVFSGSLMCEIIFDYPGVGQLISKAIYNADYNLLIGLITISIIAVATATLIIDLIYPFLDPRIRYS